MTPFSSDLPVVLITSRQEQISQFGTGFMYRLEKRTAYIITCAHVIRDVGGEALVMVEGGPATVIANGEDYGIDLAILTVEDLPEDIKVLPLDPSGKGAPTCQIIGFQQPLKDQYKVSSLQGTLLKRADFTKKVSKTRRIKGWDILIEGDDYIKPGYSGSPVIDVATGSVIGVAAQAFSEGKRAFAISTENLLRLDNSLVATTLKSISGDAPKFIQENDKAIVTTPLLIGVLADISASMLTILRSVPKRSSLSQDKVSKSINALIDGVLLFCETSQGIEISSEIAIFLYAYGFGNTMKELSKLAQILGLPSGHPEQIQSSSIRDVFESLTKRQGRPSTPTALELSHNREVYAQCITNQFLDVGGAQPQLAESLRSVYKRFSEELEVSYYKNSLLFVISSGLLGKERMEDVFESIRLIKSLGVQVVTCYVGSKNIVDSRKLYAAPEAEWPQNARLLYDCSSRIAKSSSRAQEMATWAQENGWTVPNNAALFVQINQTAMLKEFVQILLNLRP